MGKIPATLKILNLYATAILDLANERCILGKSSSQRNHASLASTILSVVSERRGDLARFSTFLDFGGRILRSTVFRMDQSHFGTLLCGSSLKLAT